MNEKDKTIDKLQSRNVKANRMEGIKMEQHF